MANYCGYIVFSLDRDTHLHVGIGMFPTFFKAISAAYADAAGRHIPDCMEDDKEVKMTSLYDLEGREDFAFDVIDKDGKIDVSYYILSCYHNRDIEKEMGFIIS